MFTHFIFTRLNQYMLNYTQKFILITYYKHQNSNYIFVKYEAATLEKVEKLQKFCEEYKGRDTKLYFDHPVFKNKEKRYSWKPQ